KPSYSQLGSRYQESRLLARNRHTGFIASDGQHLAPLLHGKDRWAARSWAVFKASYAFRTKPFTPFLHGLYGRTQEGRCLRHRPPKLYYIPDDMCSEPQTVFSLLPKDHCPKILLDVSTQTREHIRPGRHALMSPPLRHGEKFFDNFARSGKNPAYVKNALGDYTTPSIGERTYATMY